MTLRYPDSDHSAATMFGSNPLDRMSERRDDTAFVNEVRADLEGRVLLFCEDKLLTRGREAIFSRADGEALGIGWDEALFLGLDANGPLFAATLADPPADLASHNLRSLAIEGWVPDDLMGAIAQARGILGWHARHGYCANCGAQTSAGQAGMRRECASCGTQHFPRTDPVVIMLAVDGERCLLGRQTRFAASVYSCLAGFMEPGETIEAAVRREIWEEAGVRTGRVAYHASQPWPFPASLMIGCFAEALSTKIDPRDSELEDVRWFDRADIAPMLDGRHPTYRAPPPVAIAHHLLRAYAAHGAPVAPSEPLADALA